jgi:dTDP-4-dehydrorhamnose reductase
MPPPLTTVIVTGSNGLVGQKLTILLANRPALRVVAVSRGPNRNPDRWGYAYESIELEDAHQVGSLFKRFAPSAVFHCAGMTQADRCEEDPASCHRDNVAVVELLTQACASVRAHLIHMSTDFVFDGAAGPYREGDPENPLSAYGRAKLEAERLVRRLTTPWTILRLQMVYGFAPSLSRSNLVLWVLESLKAKRAIRVVNDQWRMPTLADDVADAAVTAWSLGRTGLYHISGPEMTSVSDFAWRVARRFELDEKLITPVPSSELNEKAIRPPRTGFILLKAQTELTYRPRGLDDGLTLVARQLESV